MTYTPLDSQELKMPALLLHHPSGVWQVIDLKPSVGHYGYRSCVQQHGAGLECAHLQWFDERRTW